MSYLDDFKARINANGNTIKDSQFNTTATFINAHFNESPSYRVVKLNGQDFEVQLQDIQVVTRSASVSLVQNLLKFIILRPNTFVNIGDMVEITDENNNVVTWMVTDSVSNNPLFPKAKIEKCNYTLQVKTGETTGNFKGYDQLKRPVYETIPSTTPVKCLLRNTVSNVGLNQEINLPVGQVYITVPYNDVTIKINENDNFDLYNKEFKVIGFDYSNIVNGIGVLTFTAERVVNK